MKRYIMVDVDTNARIIPTEHSTGDWIRYEDIANQTCRTCRWWGTVERNDIGSRLCKKLEGRRQVSDSFQTYDAVFLGPDFGCIHYEEK